MSSTSQITLVRRSDGSGYTTPDGRFHLRHDEGLWFCAPLRWWWISELTGCPQVAVPTLDMAKQVISKVLDAGWDAVD